MPCLLQNEFLMRIFRQSNVLVITLTNKKLAKRFFIDYTVDKSYRPTKQEVMLYDSCDKLWRCGYF